MVYTTKVTRENNFMSRAQHVKLDELKNLPHAVFSDPIFFSKYNVKKRTYFRFFGRRHLAAG